MVKYVFVSPVKRAVSTARFLGFPDPVPVEYLYYQLYYTDDGFEAIEKELGNAPLASYLDAKEGLGERLHAPVRERMATDLWS